MTPTANMTPEQLARVEIDRQLVESGWVIQDPDEIEDVLADLQLRANGGRP